jgi:hypothetical protein
MMLIRPLSTLLALACLTAPALADGRLQARYSISLAGITVGTGAWTLDIGEEMYSGTGSAKVAGPLELISSGEGTAAARGQISGAKVVPLSYSLSSTRGKKTDDVRMAMAGNVVKDFTALPPTSTGGDRVPLTEEHKKGVIDPLSAAVMPVAGSGDPLQPEACDRMLAVFDGRHRYDLIMSYDHTEPAQDVKGYSGPLIVCHVVYLPVAGHRSERNEVKTLASNKTVTLWLGPVTGTRVLVPVRVSMATTFGELVVKATQFTTAPRPRQASQPATR